MSVVRRRVREQLNAIDDLRSTFVGSYFSSETSIFILIRDFFTDTSCTDGDLSMNSKCYRKIFISLPVGWFGASKGCLYHNGSLAVFTDIGHPSDNSQLTDWLTTSGKDKTYWIGLIRSWWKTTDEGDSLLS